MAFISLIIVNIVLFFLIFIFVGFLNLVGLGIAFTIKKNKKLATTFFSIAGAIVAIIAILIIIIFCLTL